jgi:hypothetical protein
MITVRLKGGQGNQMFQYAFARALAIRNGDHFQMDLAPLLDRTPRSNFIFRGYDIDVFNIEEQLTILSRAALAVPIPVLWAGVSVFLTAVKKALSIQRVVREKAAFDLESIPRHGNFYLDGAWQDEKYFASIAPMVRKEFALREPLGPHAQGLADEIVRHESICVNVRRADFVNLPRSIQAHGFVGLEYYEKGMKLIVDRLKKSQASDLRVYVFSDEIDWCRENIKFPGIPTEYVDHEYKGKKFEVYLHLMALCKNFLIPNSTFGWWGAWLANHQEKIVVAPKQWYADPSIQHDPVPIDWIRI